MDTPRKTKLYKQLAKDYTPKQAEMMICKYIEGLELRLDALERAFAESANSTTSDTDEKKTSKKNKQESAE